MVEGWGLVLGVGVGFIINLNQPPFPIPIPIPIPIPFPIPITIPYSLLSPFPLPPINKSISHLKTARIVPPTYPTEYSLPFCKMTIGKEREWIGGRRGEEGDKGEGEGEEGRGRGRGREG